MSATKQQLIEIFGQANVQDDPALLDQYAHDESFAEVIRPRFIVRPKDVAQVEALVKLANATQTPLVPVSSGAPHFRGDTVPSVAEAVIVDLSGMKAIRKIDPRNRIAIIEPGVTYAELIPALAEQGLRLPQPLMPRANKSVVASLIERQPTTIPRLNFSLPEPLRTLGVVWGSGEVAFTGEAGGGPLSLEEQWKRGLAQVDPKGPAFTDLMRLITGAQGSMGIVVWASVKLEYIPAARAVYFVPSQDVGGLVDLVYKLTKIRVGDELFVINRSRLANLLGTPSAVADQLPEWVLIVALGGVAHFPEERVKVQEDKLKAEVQQLGLTLSRGLPGITHSQILGLLDGVGKAEPASRDIFFLSTLDKAPHYVDLVADVARRNGYPGTKIGIYVQPQHQGVAHHVEFNLPFDEANDAEFEKVRNIYFEASEELIAQGAYFSRPYGYWSDLIYERDATSTELLRIAKNIVDPENVMNPGKLCF